MAWIQFMTFTLKIPIAVSDETSEGLQQTTRL